MNQTAARRIVRLAPIAAILAAAGIAAGQGTAFTYQGDLANSGQPAAGLHDLQFRLFSAAAGGAQFGPTLCSDNVAIADGRFTVSLDFGSVFDGTPVFLEIAVRPDSGANCSSGAGFVTLSPRQPVTPAPYAVHALDARSAQLFGGQPTAFFTNAANLSSGVLADARIPATLPRLNAAGNQTFTGPLSFANSAQFQNASFASATGTFTGTGTGLTGLNASNLASGTVADARLSANVALRSAANTFVANQTFSANVGIGGAPNANDLHIVGNADVGGNLDVGTLTMNPATRTLAIPGAAFSNGNVIGYDDGTCGNTGGVASQISTGVAPVNLPDGATITRVDFYLDDAALVANFDVFLLRRSFDGVNPGGTMAQASTSGDSGLQVFADTTISAPVIDNANFFYFLRVNFGAQFNIFGLGGIRAIKITYTVDRPLP